MLIGIVGDTHNNLKNISLICDIFNEKKVSLVLHTGDITLPKSLKIFKNLEMKLIGVFGNNDQAEKEDLMTVSKEFNCELYDDPFSFVVDEIKISILHDPKDISKSLLKRSDLIFHGHTHRYRNETLENTLIFNPGECAGFLKDKNKIGIFDTVQFKVETISF